MQIKFFHIRACAWRGKRFNSPNPSLPIYEFKNKSTTSVIGGKRNCGLEDGAPLLLKWTFLLCIDRLIWFRRNWSWNHFILDWLLRWDGTWWADDHLLVLFISFPFPLCSLTKTTCSALPYQLFRIERNNTARLQAATSSLLNWVTIAINALSTRMEKTGRERDLHRILFESWDAIGRKRGAPFKANWVGTSLKGN